MSTVTEGRGGPGGGAWAAYHAGSGPEVSELLPLAVVRQLALKVEHFYRATLPSQPLDLLDARDGPVHSPVVSCGKHDAARALAEWLPVRPKPGADEGCAALAGGVLLEIVQGAPAHAVDGLGVDGEPLVAVALELVWVDLGIGLLQGAGGLVLPAGLLVGEDRPRDEPVQGLCDLGRQRNGRAEGEGRRDVVWDCGDVEDLWCLNPCRQASRTCSIGLALALARRAVGGLGLLVGGAAFGSGTAAPVEGGCAAVVRIHH